MSNQISHLDALEYYNIQMLKYANARLTSAGHSDLLLDAASVGSSIVGVVGGV